jgi:hypothetical protein
LDIEALDTLLLEPPADVVEASLARLAPGSLWEALLPGASPSMVLKSMGEAAPMLLRASLQALGDVDPALASAGLPFPWNGTPDALAAALIAQAAVPSVRDAISLSVPGLAEVSMAEDLSVAGCVVELRHAPRSVWQARVFSCLDHAASCVVHGSLLDPLDALLLSPGIDLRPLLGIADTATRVRFCAAIRFCAQVPSGRHSDGYLVPGADHTVLAAFRRGYFRRSAAAGLLGGIQEALAGLRGGLNGTDADGWPLWWEGRGPGHEAILAGIRPGIVAAAQSVRLFRSETGA